jgi:hypothetical protein
MTPTTPPTPVVVHGRPLTRQPDERVERQAVIRRAVDEIAGVSVRIALVMPGRKEHLGLVDELQHEWCDREYAICGIAAVARCEPWPALRILREGMSS